MRLELSLALTLACQLISSGCAGPSPLPAVAPAHTRVYDASRDRHIPVDAVAPSEPQPAGGAWRVALLCPGYGVSHTGYSHLAQTLASAGFLVISVQTHQDTDPPLATEGDLYAARLPSWQEGVKDVLYVRGALAGSYQGADFSRVLLVGHSNGGDIAALLAGQQPEAVLGVITLDHRRVPLPRVQGLPVLSLRATDYPADPGVLPDEAQARQLGTRIVTLDGALHAGLDDTASPTLQAQIDTLVLEFVTGLAP